MPAEDVIGLLTKLVLSGNVAAPLATVRTLTNDVAGQPCIIAEGNILFDIVVVKALGYRVASSTGVTLLYYPDFLYSK